MRSRATWYEKGERNNKYFLNLENKRNAKNCIRKLFNKKNQLVKNSKDIMTELKSFYQDLYRNKDNNMSAYWNENFQKFTQNLNIPKLSDDQQSYCEGDLTYQECLKALNSFKNNKSPGNDGLTAEFYKKFWPILGHLLVESLNTAYRLGKLSNSQRQALIRLIEKKDKDRRCMENWRPVSLLNVDYKIGSKALATRLEKVLPDIIHEDQCAYVKGRTIFDAITSIDDVMEYTKVYNKPGLLTTFDFKKAFDSISRKYLLAALRNFNFGNSIIRWIEVLYDDIVECAVRQGDPLSPYLFIIALEILSIAIRQNKDIEGIQIGEGIIKHCAFADDLTTFVKNAKSLRSLQNLLKTFGDISGLRLNKEKTEAYWLGSLHHSCENIGIEKINKPIKILGVFFTYDKQKFQELNFENIIKSINKSISAWQWRNLTLLGRIQIVKTFAIPKFMFRAAQIPLTKEIIKEINSVIFKFVWRGRDKVKRLSLVSDYRDGGLRMPHIESLIKTQRIMCLKKYHEDYKSSWKLFLNFYLHNVGGPFLLQCNYDTASFAKNIPKFYTECLKEWETYQQKQISASSHILDQIIWNNKFIKIGGRSLYRCALVNKGIVRIKDILDTESKLHKWNVLKDRHITQAEYFILMSIYDALPLGWKMLLKEGRERNRQTAKFIFPSSSKTLYWDIISKY